MTETREGPNLSPGTRSALEGLRSPSEPGLNAGLVALEQVSPRLGASTYPSEEGSERATAAIADNAEVLQSGERGTWRS